MQLKASAINKLQRTAVLYMVYFKDEMPNGSYYGLMKTFDLLRIEYKEKAISLKKRLCYKVKLNDSSRLLSFFGNFFIKIRYFNLTILVNQVNFKVKIVQGEVVVNFFDDRFISFNIWKCHSHYC